MMMAWSCVCIITIACHTNFLALIFFLLFYFYSLVLIHNREISIVPNLEALTLISFEYRHCSVATSDKNAKKITSILEHQPKFTYMCTHLRNGSIWSWIKHTLLLLGLNFSIHQRGYNIMMTIIHNDNNNNNNSTGKNRDRHSNTRAKDC